MVVVPGEACASVYASGLREPQPSPPPITLSLSRSSGDELPYCVDDDALVDVECDDECDDDDVGSEGECWCGPVMDVPKPRPTMPLKPGGPAYTE